MPVPGISGRVQQLQEDSVRIADHSPAIEGLIHDRFFADGHILIIIWLLHVVIWDSTKNQLNI